MARNLVLVVAIVATLLHGSAATSHVVGDSTGWVIPSGGASTYTNWASKQTFKQGDTLVFNFANGQHNVAKVTKSAYDACNGSNAITTVTTSPATITLNETGQHYFICAFSGHCAAGQKLAVTVKASSPSPAPQPSSSPKAASPTPAPKSSSPAPTPASAPAPATGPVTYTVGGSSGWIIPTSGGAAFYTSWASGKTFKVGDILVFNFAKNQHNVEEVTKNNYDACSTSSPIATYTAAPVRVTLNKTGEHYFICGFNGHCAAGQKLAINVTGGTGSTPSSPSPSPSGSETPSPGSSPTNPSSPSPAGSSGGSTSPPPQGSGAASLKAFGFSAALISVVAAAFFC